MYVSEILLKITVFFVLLELAISEDLYEVLGVHRGATIKEIKAAYKQLAREWHPDKNKDPEATDRFTKINEAYETLGDPERRRDYDNFGYTSAQERNKPGSGQHPNFGGFPFDEFFGGGFEFRGFGGNRPAASIIDKHLTTLRNYETKLQPESHRTPCFVYAFGNFCFNCMRVEHIIEKFIEELENVGLCVATVHIQRNPDLASHLRTHSVPDLLGVVNGRVTRIKFDYISLQHLRDFVRQLFPKNTIKLLKDAEADNFLENWRNNQVTAIFFSPRPDPSARFLAPAFFHRDRIAFAYVCTSVDDSIEMVRKFNVNKRRETLLIFNEDISSPAATISMQQLSRSTIEEVITDNRFLVLPRLSSQSVFDELCPKEPKVKRRKFCVALVTNKVVDHDIHHERFRQFATSSAMKLNPERVRFVYLYEDVQQKVIQALTKGNTTRTTTVLEVAIIWHQDDRRVSYEFLEQGWSLDPEQLPASHSALQKRLSELLETDHLLPYRAVMPDFYNEHALGLLTRIYHKVYDWGDRVWFFLVGYHPTTYIMTFMGIAMLAFMSFLIKKMADAENAHIKSQRKPTARKAPRPPSSTPDNQTIHLYELNESTFNNLVKEADTGLTIIVLVDEDSKEQLLRRFAELMQTYSRYSALTFGFLRLEYYIAWYQHLLETSLNNKVKLDSINIRNCIGTVLALNGYRKYYYIYHPRRAQKWIRSQNRMGQAMGFMDSDSDSDTANPPTETEDKLFVNELLSGLVLWMDRLFDGSVRKVRMDYWPEM